MPVAVRNEQKSNTEFVKTFPGQYTREIKDIQKYKVSFRQIVVYLYMHFAVLRPDRNPTIEFAQSDSNYSIEKSPPPYRNSIVF